MWAAMVENWHLWAGGLGFLALLAVSIYEGDKLSAAKHAWHENGLAAAGRLRDNPPGGVHYQIRHTGLFPRYYIVMWHVEDPMPVPSFRRWVPDPFVPKGDYSRMYADLANLGPTYFSTVERAERCIQEMVNPEDAPAPEPPFRLCFDRSGKEVTCV